MRRKIKRKGSRRLLPKTGETWMRVWPFLSLAMFAALPAIAQEQLVGRLVCERTESSVNSAGSSTVYAPCSEQWLPTTVGADGEPDWSFVVGKMLSGQGIQGAVEGVQLRRSLSSNIELVIDRSVLDRYGRAGTPPGFLTSGVLSSESGRYLNWKLTAPSPNRYVVVYSIWRDSKS